MIEKIKKLLDTRTVAPTVEAVKKAAGEVGSDLAKAHDELDGLRHSRDDLLLVSDEQEILKHDEAIRALETRVEALEARRVALRQRLNELEADEAVSAIPKHLKRMEDHLAAYKELDAALQSALGALRESSAELGTARALVMMKRPDAVGDLPVVPEEMSRQIRDLLGPSVRVLKRP